MAGGGGAEQGGLSSRARRMREHFVGSNHERGQVHRVRVGATEGEDPGPRDALRARLGRLPPVRSDPAIITAASCPVPTGFANYRYEWRLVYTNTAPTSPDRGAGRPHGVFVMEKGARAVGARAAPRPRGCPPAQPHRPTTSPTTSACRSRTVARRCTTPGTYGRVLEMVLDAVGWDGGPPSFRPAASRRSAGHRVRRRTGACARHAGASRAARAARASRPTRCATRSGGGAGGRGRARRAYAHAELPLPEGASPGLGSVAYYSRPRARSTSAFTPPSCR